MSDIVRARNEDHPSTQYLQFEPKREMREGLNSASATDVNPGFSPISRWMMVAFDYDDFASNPDVVDSYKASFIVPTDTIALRCVLRIDEAFDNASDVNVGDDSTADGWMDGMDLESTGGKFDPDGDYQPGGSTGGCYYEDGDTIDIETASGTAPTAGKGLLALEVISYHEDAEAEW